MSSSKSGGRDVSSTSSASPQPSQARADEGLQWRMRWLDDGAVDLTSPTATFIRAVTEARYLVLFDWDPDDEFPGLEEAAPVWWTKDPAPSNDPFNTVDAMLKIASLREVGNDTVSAVVCSTGQTASSETEFPLYFSPANPPSKENLAVSIVRLTIERSGQAPPKTQVGDQLFPHTHVFGDWKLTEYKSAWAPNVPGETAPSRSICGDMGDLTASGPSYPGWS